MGKRKKPEQIQRLLVGAERDLAKGLSVSDICRKVGVGAAGSQAEAGRARPQGWQQRPELQEQAGSVQERRLGV